jgi:hypothetical protein
MERIESYADPDRDMKRYYRTSWQAMLQVLLDWPGSDAARWASYELDRVGERPFLTHEHAASYIERVLTRDVPFENGSLGALRSGLTYAIHVDEPSSAHGDPSATRAWLLRARPRVEAVLRQYGGTLPTFDATRDGW